MPRLIPFESCAPILGSDVFVAPGATLIGDVTVGAGSSIWFGSVLRGDVNAIRIGNNTNVQDLSVIHVTSVVSDKPMATHIGDNVTIGHRVILHGCTIADNVLIGMGAIVMDGASIGKNCVIGAGSLVTEGTYIPEGHLALGSPARIKRLLTEFEIAGLELSAMHYRELAAKYRLGA